MISKRVSHNLTYLISSVIIMQWRYCTLCSLAFLFMPDSIFEKPMFCMFNKYTNHNVTTFWVTLIWSTHVSLVSPLFYCLLVTGKN